MARRRLDVFSLSFLDCMSCGFGAVILFFMIINTGSTRATDNRVVTKLHGEVARLERLVEEGRRHLVVLRTDLELQEAERIAAETRLQEALASLSASQEALLTLEAQTLATQQDVAAQMADLRSAEEALQRLEGGSLADEKSGDALRSVVGEGDRQYLTGLKVGGSRIFILVDTSASMLDDEIAKVLVRRNQALAERLAAPKWRRVVASVDWLTARLPAAARFQIYGFAETADPVLPGTAGDWIPASDPGRLDEAVKRLGETAPAGGTSLLVAFRALAAMDPPPDNVYLLVDGLPTRGDKAPWRSVVSESGRLRHLTRAVRELPREVPLNILLFPMEGDPLAATSYWQLARRTSGAFLAPSRDWP